MKRLFKCLPILLLICILCACAEQTPPPTEPVYYTVTYMVGETVYATQSVEAGMVPAAVEPKIDGLVITGWVDETQVPVQPQSIPVNRNICYTAEAEPRLTEHTPFLQVDDNGFLHPEDPLTGQQLLTALQALSPEAAWPFFPEIPEGETVSAQQLKTVLTAFVTQEQLAEVSLEDTQAMTRAAFADVMCCLLGRTTDETFILAASAVIPGDVTVLREDAAVLLESCVRHTQDPEGKSWTDIELVTGWEPGMVLKDGWLYYVQPDGRLLRDGKEGKLYFGADGRYTSGDPELDTLVAEKLNTIVQANPELSGLELLRKVYDHCHQDYKYIRKDAYGLGATGWDVEDAKEMLQKGRGNCYNFAAVFWALASGLGYDVQCLAGTCTGTDQPHGWVVMYYEGEYYFVDPEWQYAYTEREVFDHDMFMLTMDEVWYWTYQWDKTQFGNG